MARSHQYAYIDEDFVGPALLCIICRKPFKNPQCAPCNHTFCRECITKWMAERGSSCPACHRPISVGSFSQISELLEYLLGRLFVKCLFCGQTKIRQAEFDDHIARGCPNVQQPRLTYEQLPTSTIQPFLSIFSELLAEIRQLREQSQQQLNQLRKQAADIKRINQRYDQHETMIDELRRQMAGEQTDGFFHRDFIDLNRQRIIHGKISLPKAINIGRKDLLRSMQRLLSQHESTSDISC